MKTLLTNDLELLAAEGAIAFYQSCEVTEIFLFEKNSKKVTNIFTLVVFEDRQFESRNQHFLGNRIQVEKNLFAGIQCFQTTIEEGKQLYQTLLNEKLWNNLDGQGQKVLSLNSLPKQYVPGKSGGLNRVIKNNFHSGSYVLEFFDVEKQGTGFLVAQEKLRLFEKIGAEIQKYLPIDISSLSDRLGNYVFQFPITLVDLNSNATENWNGVELHFAWHLKQVRLPQVQIILKARLEENLTGFYFGNYDGNASQTVYTGSLDNIVGIELWDKSTALLLYSSSAPYLRNINFGIGLISHEQRVFEIDGKMQRVEVAGRERTSTIGPKSRDYRTMIQARKYKSEKEGLISNLSFKQYSNQPNEALGDVRTLINRHGKVGVYLWDPFLTGEDALKTLFFCKESNLPLRAIGSINPTVKLVYQKKGANFGQIIQDYALQIENSKSNFYNLDFEFRIQFDQHGKAFHDRFLLFPGDLENPPRVYSLGTSVNSLGKDHHILQEVNHPQPVLDAFNELWNQLNHPDCLVWKHP